MSTLAYAALTTRRDWAARHTSRSTEPPGVGTWVDALAALVPAEVLGLHAIIVSLTTKTEDAQAGGGTVITDRTTLAWSFAGLCVLSVALYVVPRLMRHLWDGLDYVRSLIPLLAFVGWTMLQRTTAFDAVWPDHTAPRMVIALFLAVALALAAAALGSRTDGQDAKPRR
jgi:hypothetical protein